MNPIKQAALSVGFDACGIAKAEELTDDAKFLQSWLAEGNHGEMHYLARNFEKRTDPRQLVPDCKSVVVVLMNYFPTEKQNPSAPQIAKYAFSETDYHQVMKAKLSELEQKICTIYGNECVCTDYQHSFVDSAPVLERRWAERAGLGWIGKHTQLISPQLGSYTFIGILLLNIALNYDSPIRSRCGSCTRCINFCPTKALTTCKLDARRCLSYLTIEKKNEIPAEFQSQISNCALGCDICADVCPWNQKWAKPHNHTELFSKNISLLNTTINTDNTIMKSFLDWNADIWKQLTKKDFNQTFRHSAVKRAGYKKLKQNIETINKIARSEDNIKLT